MSNINFPQDTSGVTPATGDIIMFADVSDSNYLKDTTLADLPISTATQTAINAKQDTLVSGTNIKTVNGNSLLGSGDLVISGGGGVTDHGALTGLADDDHTQYTKADGTRAFTGKQSYSSHPTFSADTELVDKKYVDDSITAGGGYTDEQAQDAVGGILVDSSTIDFTYNDATPSITGSVIDGSITTTKLGGDITTAGKALLDDADASTQRTTLGLGTTDSPEFTAINVGSATDTTISRVSAGRIAVEGVNVPTISSTDTLTNKTIALGSNTVSGTFAQFNTAVTDADFARSDASQTFTGTQTFAQIICTNNAITASGNAATVPVTYKTNTVTNNSAATLTITLTTSGAVDRQIVEVCILDYSAVAQTISWVNTENSTVTAPTTSNGSTTLPLSVLFQYNNATSKWRVLAYS